MAKRGFSFKAPKWKPVTDGIVDDIAQAATDTMDEVTLGLKNELRAQVEAAGMGGKLAKTWRGRRYPVSKPSIEAAAYVFSKAPDIVDAFDRAPVIRTVNGRKYLAIPTANVPRTTSGTRGGSHRMTPAEVENYFNQDLKFARTKKGRLIAFIDVVGTAAGGFRRPTGRQLGRLYRGIKAPARHTQVVMFILTPKARMPKRFNVDAAAQHWANTVGPILESNLAKLK